MYLIFDTETTGLPTNWSAPISDVENWPNCVQLAWQTYNNKGDLIDVQSHIINIKDKEIPLESANIHKIYTENSREYGLDLKEVLEKFTLALEKAEYVVGHNVLFDINVISCEYYRLNMTKSIDLLNKKVVIDTMKTTIDYCAIMTHEKKSVVVSSGYVKTLPAFRGNVTHQFKVVFDNWFFESSLGELADKKSEIFQALDQVKKEHAYEKNGAVWLESTKFGDDKDRVIIREDGRGTYLSADLAYHRNKLDRGFDTIINVWGSDHHGYIKRIEATIEAMGYSKKQMQVQLVQFANLFENGSKVKMSTRSGNFYTLKQLIDDIGPDASRFYYLSKQADQHLDFDIGIARSNSKENLYYYVQYAHARICSVEKKYLELGMTLPTRFNDADFDGCDELLQMALNSQFVIKSSGENLQPHLIVYYLRDISQSFHQFYNSVNILNAKESEQNNIMRALIIVKSVIASSLELLGIEPLNSM